MDKKMAKYDLMTCLLTPQVINWKNAKDPVPFQLRYFRESKRCNVGR